MRKLNHALLAKFRISTAEYISVKAINGIFAVKSKGLLVRTFARMLPAIGLGTTRFRVSVIVHFVSYCSKIYKNQGMKGLVINLKTQTVLLQQALSGFVLKDETPLGCRVRTTNRGLLRLIPQVDRALIRGNNYDLMRFWLTLTNLYRVLEFPGKLKLQSITNPPNGNKSRADLQGRLFRYIPDYVRLVRTLAGDQLHLQKLRMNVIPKSSPSTSGQQISTSPMALIQAAGDLRVNGLIDTVQYFYKYFERTSEVGYPGLPRILDEAANLRLNPVNVGWTHSSGKLGFKQEAAGKVRVFAMVDAWTNWALQPLHDELFRILSKFPTDGTFDQMAPIRRADQWRNKEKHSLDLTAATDRLPIAIQVGLLASMYGTEFAVQWAMLLVNRDYRASSDQFLPEGPVSLRYATGQPMGALSSWAMLSFTHHFIIQVAAWEAKVVPVGQLFSDYAVLGDDVVIGNTAVKDKYLEIIDALGMEIGLHKSVLSSKGTGMEFAKRTFINGVDVSPVPLLEFISMCWTLPGALAFGSRYKLPVPRLLKALGFGFRVLGGLNKHVGLLNSRVRAVLLGTLLPPIDDAEAIKTFLERGNPLKVSMSPTDPVVKEFAAFVLKDIKTQISAAYKFNLATFSKEMGNLVVKRLTSPFFLVGFLEKFIPDGLVELGKLPRYVMDPSQSLVQLPPHVYNALEDAIRSVRLSVTRLTTSVLGDEVSKSRDIFEKLVGDLSAVEYASNPIEAYVWALSCLNTLGRANTNYTMHRVDEQVRRQQSIKQLRLWRLYTRAINAALAKDKSGTMKQGK